MSTSRYLAAFGGTALSTAVLPAPPVRASAACEVQNVAATATTLAQAQAGRRQ